MNRFQIALQLLEKAYPGIENEFRGSILHKSSAEDHADKSSPDLEVFSQFIYAYQPLPFYSIFLGVCEDGLPLLLDLEDNSLGPILISGAHSASIQNYLAILLRSIRTINPPQNVQYQLISPNQFAYEREIQPSYCHGAIHPHDRAAGRLIMDLSALVEQRNNGRQRGPAIILMIEDMDRFIRTMDDDVYSHFLWLLREGPFAKVWPFVSLHLGSRLFTDFKFESLFDTKIKVSNSFSPFGSQPFIAETNPIPFQLTSGEHHINYDLPFRY